MKIKYQHYEPNQGLEEVQAKIWLEAQRRLDPEISLPSFEETVNNIKERFEAENLDKKSIRYAFTEDDKPLAYIQTRVNDNRNLTEISFPWGVEKCPQEVQMKLFEEMKDYISKRDKGSERRFVVGGLIDSNWPNAAEIIESNGFKQDRILINYKYNTDKLRYRSSENFEVVEGNYKDEKNLAALIDLGLVDETAIAAFPTEEQIRGYYQRIQEFPLKTRLVFKDNLIVAAGAVRIEQDRNPSIQFTFYRPGHENAWKCLMVELAKVCSVESTKPLICYYEDETTELGLVRDLEEEGYATRGSKRMTYHLPDVL